MVKCKVYETTILEIARREEEDRKKGEKWVKKRRSKRMYEEKLKNFTHEEEDAEMERKLKMTANKRNFRRWKEALDKDEETEPTDDNCSTPDEIRMSSNKSKHSKERKEEQGRRRCEKCL